MGAHINKDLKELIITLAAVIGFGDVLVKTGRLHQEDEDAAKLMMGAATTISQHLLQGRDAEQVEALQRQAGFYEIIAVPKSSAQIGKEYYICPKEDFERLVIDDPSSPCPYCELEGREAHIHLQRGAIPAVVITSQRCAGNAHTRRGRRCAAGRAILSPLRGGKQRQRCYMPPMPASVNLWTRFT